MKKLELIGEKFGKLSVIAEGERKAGRTNWVCRCECGGEVTVGVGSLRSGNSKSCGCSRIEHLRSMDRSSFKRKTGPREGSKIHHPLYATWQAMIRRCYSPSEASYRNYGGRGIGVCEEWRNDFWSFVRDMGDRPKGTSIDRIDNDMWYEPSNCRWATPVEQTRNRRCNVLDEADVSFIRTLLSFGMTPTAIGSEYGLGASRISHIKHSHSWRSA